MVSRITSLKAMPIGPDAGLSERVLDMTERRFRMQLFDLTGRVAIVTGGNGGIGLGMARGLAQAGAAIVIAGRNADKSAAAVQEIEKLGAKAASIEVDVTS